MIPWASLKYSGAIDLNLSCPAVSQIYKKSENRKKANLAILGLFWAFLGCFWYLEPVLLLIDLNSLREEHRADCRLEIFLEGGGDVSLDCGGLSHP